MEGEKPTRRLLGPGVLLPVLQDVGEADGDVDGWKRRQRAALWGTNREDGDRKFNRNK